MSHFFLPKLLDISKINVEKLSVVNILRNICSKNILLDTIIQYFSVKPLKVSAGVSGSCSDICSGESVNNKVC